MYIAGQLLVGFRLCNPCFHLDFLLSGKLSGEIFQQNRPFDLLLCFHIMKTVHSQNILNIAIRWERYFYCAFFNVPAESVTLHDVLSKSLLSVQDKK